jgi:hypothetical protein
MSYGLRHNLQMLLLLDQEVAALTVGGDLRLAERLQQKQTLLVLYKYSRLHLLVVQQMAWFDCGICAVEWSTEALLDILGPSLHCSLTMSTLLLAVRIAAFA